MRMRTILEIVNRTILRAMTWTTHALDVLDDAGYRRGGARRAVVELLGRQNCCLSAQEIFDGLRKARRPVGIASVYRALEALTELRLVKRVDAGDGIARYEPARSQARAGDRPRCGRNGLLRRRARGRAHRRVR
ncbi:MAG: hypothetical protein E6G64_04415 [Actinobacteria bacterium]|nr:MAG: hypothetical protein E6G64_04415 [Actinomycetota bacterium]